MLLPSVFHIIVVCYLFYFFNEGGESFGKEEPEGELNSASSYSTLPVYVFFFEADSMQSLFGLGDLPSRIMATHLC